MLSREMYIRLDCILENETAASLFCLSLKSHLLPRHCHTESGTSLVCAGGQHLMLQSEANLYALSQLYHI